MKTTLKKLTLLVLLIFSSVVHGQYAYDTELENVTLKCKITSAGTGTVYFGFLTITYKRYHLICNNGYESYWDELWW